MVWLKGRKRIFWFIVSAVLLLLGLLWSRCAADNKITAVDLRIKNDVIKAEVVRAPADLYKGLSGRESLCASCGMLFDFSDSDIRQFVMRDMKFPLDIIFINEGRIVGIAANLRPEGSSPQNVYSSDAPADRVLEVNAGYAVAHDWQRGDEVRAE